MISPSGRSFLVSQQRATKNHLIPPKAQTQLIGRLRRQLKEERKVLARERRLSRSLLRRTAQQRRQRREVS